MTAPTEVTQPREEPNKKAVEQTAQELMPTINWPFNSTILNNPTTTIRSFQAESGPGITIETSPHSDFAIRAPVDGKMEIFEQPDNTTTAVLLAEDTRLIVLLGNIQRVATREQDLIENEPADPDALTIIKTGDIIGSLGRNSRGLNVQVAYRPRGPTEETNWELIDPRLVLPPLG